jgi:hypothetical protein
MTDPDPEELTERPARPARKSTAPPPEVVGVPVVVLATRGQAALVQWFEGTTERRCTVPADAVKDGAVPAEVLAQGVPYGVPWAQLLTVETTAEHLEAALHGAGLWTLADVQRSPMAAVSALQAAYGVDLGRLLTAAAAHHARNKEAGL